MDGSINRILQAVQEEFPPARKQRRQSSSNHSSNSRPSFSSSSRHNILLADDNRLPTSDELSLASPALTEETATGSALSTSPDSTSASRSGGFLDSQTQMEPQSPAGYGGEQQLSSRDQVSSSSALPGESVYLLFERRTYSSHTLILIGSSIIHRRVSPPAILYTALNTAVQSSTPKSTRSPRFDSAPTFISMPGSTSKNGGNATTNPANSGFKLSAVKGDSLMLTPGGDDLPFIFKKRPSVGMQRRESQEVFV
jgi:hypothetical protein